VKYTAAVWKQYNKMFQGPKGYIAKICEVHLQYGNKMAVLHCFPVNSTLIYILFSLFQPKEKRVLLSNDVDCTDDSFRGEFIG